MNHSCAANVLDLGLDFGLAVRDIPSGTEVSCDYGTFFGDGDWSMNCVCGELYCRERIRSGDHADSERRADWARAMTPALQDATGVPQPLGPLLSNTSTVFRDIMAGVIACGDPSAPGRSVVRPGIVQVGR